MRQADIIWAFVMIILTFSGNMNLAKNLKRKKSQSLTSAHHFLKSKTKDPPKFLSSSGIRGGIFISVYNFTAQ